MRINNLYIWISIVVVSLLLTGCPKKNDSSGGFAKNIGDCPLERFDWMKVSDGYDQEKLLKLAAELKAAAEADAKQIKGLKKLDAEANFDAKLDKTVEEYQSRGVEVSQEFYESYLRQRTRLCALYEAIKDDLFSTTTLRIRAEDAYIEVAKGFDDAYEKEEKKSRN